MPFTSPETKHVEILATIRKIIHIDMDAFYQRVMQIFRKYTSMVEPLSRNEAFLDVTGHLAPNGSATLLARQICAEIRKTIGLSASAGVSFNKFLAKVAPDINKPNGITSIAPAQALSFLDCLSIRKFSALALSPKRKCMHSTLVPAATCGVGMNKSLCTISARPDLFSTATR